MCGTMCLLAMRAIAADEWPALYSLAVAAEALYNVRRPASKLLAIVKQTSNWIVIVRLVLIEIQIVATAEHSLNE